jgi:hypothetical protein
MERGLLAPLSPNEELALRRVAAELAHPTSASGRDVQRLKKLVWSCKSTANCT